MARMPRCVYPMHTDSLEKKVLRYAQHPYKYERVQHHRNYSLFTAMLCGIRVYYIRDSK